MEDADSREHEQSGGDRRQQCRRRPRQRLPPDEVDLPRGQLVDGAAEFRQERRLQVLADREFQAAEKLRRRVHQREVAARHVRAETVGAADERKHHDAEGGEQDQHDKHQQWRQRRDKDRQHDQHRGADRDPQQHVGGPADSLRFAHQLRDARVAQTHQLRP